MKVGFLLFDDVTQLDAMGPLQFISRMPDAQTMTIAKTKAPIQSDCPVKLVPTHDFDDAPALDFLCVPGGFGTVGAIKDNEIVDYVRTQGGRAEYVTSVCTGAFILGAAGLLQGKRATTHWAYTDFLPIVGATHEGARVVRDGNIFTGGGVTAGIDFALTVIAAIKGESVAQSLQLGLEYNPSPPFNAGTLKTAPDAIGNFVSSFYDESRASTRAALTEVMEYGR